MSGDPLNRIRVTADALALRRTGFRWATREGSEA